MHGKSSLADGKNHQNPHTSKHLFVLKTSSLNIERDVNKKKTLKQTADARRKTQTVDGRRKTQTADRRRKTQTADRRRKTQTETALSDPFGFRNAPILRRWLMSSFQTSILRDAHTI